MRSSRGNRGVQDSRVSRLSLKCHRECQFQRIPKILLVKVILSASDELISHSLKKELVRRTNVNMAYQDRLHTCHCLKSFPTQVDRRIHS